MALGATLVGLVVALVPPWVEERRVPGGHPFARQVVSRGYAFVGAPPAAGADSLSGVRPDWPKSLTTWAVLCVAVWCIDGSAWGVGLSILALIRRRASRAYVAEHRVGIAVAGALLLPVPVPLGLLLLLLLPAGGFVGSGHTGVGAGGPQLFLLLAVLMGLLAGVIFALLTLFLRHALRMDVPWWPSKART